MTWTDFPYKKTWVGGHVFRRSRRNREGILPKASKDYGVKNFSDYRLVNTLLVRSRVTLKIFILRAEFLIPKSKGYHPPKGILLRVELSTSFSKSSDFCLTKAHPTFMWTHTCFHRWIFPKVCPLNVKSEGSCELALNELTPPGRSCLP